MTTVRRAGATSAATLCGLALVIVLAQAIAPEWTRRFGLDLWNLPEAMAHNQECSQETIMLSCREERLQQEVELADHLCSDIIQGRITLASAMAEMEPVLLQRPGFVLTCRSYYHAPTLKHSVGRYFIRRIARHYDLDDPKIIELLADLERQYAQIQ
jgi:hypothetical protein